MMRPQNFKKAQDSLTEEELTDQKRVSKSYSDYEKGEISLDCAIAIVKEWNRKHPELSKIHPEDHKNKSARYLGTIWWEK